MIKKSKNEKGFNTNTKTNKPKQTKQKKPT